ncbi:hypothetical protein VTH06DRAFT_7510 [Thermothelomyces fergusii]
MSRYG